MPVRSVQVENFVRDLADRLGPGALLPGERELAQRCGVSRMTVRRALEDLEARRVIERRHGAGTFVRRPAAAQPLMATSFHEDMRRRGLEPSSKVITSTSTTADANLAARLHIDEGAAVVVVRRLRLADAEPMALETLHVPAERLPGFSAAELDGDTSYYRLLRERYGRLVSAGTQSVAPVVLDDESAELLDVAPGSAALRFVRVSCDQHGDVVELVDAIYRGDRYLIEVDLLPPREPAP